MEIFSTVLNPFWTLTLAPPARAGVPTLAPYASAVSNLLFYGNFRSKEDCRAAKEQERRLATT
jgi:hypothetical protein